MKTTKYFPIKPFQNHNSYNLPCRTWFQSYYSMAQSDPWPTFFWNLNQNYRHSISDSLFYQSACLPLWPAHFEYQWAVLEVWIFKYLWHAGIRMLFLEILRSLCLRIPCHPLGTKCCEFIRGLGFLVGRLVDMFVESLEELVHEFYRHGYLLKACCLEIFYFLK